jgi:flagellar biosynthesis chaperone FliJ
MQAETDDLTDVLSALEEKLSQFGGYLQQKEIYQGSAYRGTQRRSANLVIRIPAQDLNAFLSHLNVSTHVISSNETVDDVTLHYIDVDSQLKALKTEEERLLTMMEKAENLSDLLAIEQRLTQVQQELQSIASQLKSLDSQIEYATIHLSVSEVVEYTPVEEETPWQRIGSGFMDSLSDIWVFLVDTFVFLIANSPRLVLLGGIAAVVILLIRRNKKRKKAKKNPPAA